HRCLDSWIGRIGLFRGNFSGSLRQSDGPRSVPVAPGFLDASINRDAKQPRAESGPLVEAGEMAIDERKHLLDRVSRLIRIHQDAPRDGENLLVVLRVEFLKRTGIPAEESLD